MTPLAIGLGVVGAAVIGIGIYEHVHQASATSASGTWHDTSGTGTLKAGTPIAIAVPNPPAEVAAFVQQIAAGAGNVTGAQTYAVGTSPPADWPSDDTFGTTALRVYGVLKADTPFDTSTLTSYGGKGWAKF